MTSEFFPVSWKVMDLGEAKWEWIEPFLTAPECG